MVGRTAIHVSKDGLTGNPRLVGHHITGAASAVASARAEPGRPRSPVARRLSGGRPGRRARHAGLGSRLVMRLLAVADPDAEELTENGNQVGDVTLDGTLGLVGFCWRPHGHPGRADRLRRSPLAPHRPPWRGLAFPAVLLALLGGTVIDPENIDLRLLEPAGLAIAPSGCSSSPQASGFRCSPTGNLARRAFTEWTTSTAKGPTRSW